MEFLKNQQTVEESAKQIRLLLLDVDGVLTDGRLYFTNSGEEIKSFSTLDGHGIKMLMRSDIEVGIITGRTSNIVSKRAADLGIGLLYQGREDKRVVLDEILASRDLNLEDIAYAGDDFPDLGVMKSIGLPLTVPGAHQEARKIAHAVSHSAAGAGAVREMADFILRCQGKYLQHLE